jgi:hypothetical protein
MFEDVEKIYENQKLEKILEDKYGKPLKVEPNNMPVDDITEDDYYPEEEEQRG